MMKIILICLSVILILELFRVYYKNSKKYKLLHNGTINLVGRIPSNLEIVAIGSGPGKNGIFFEYAKERGHNFCTAPQSFKYGFRILKKFSKKIKKNAVIISVICPLSFGYNKDCLSDNYSDEFYGILKPSEIEGYSLKRALSLRYLFLNDWLKKIKSNHNKKKEIKTLRQITVVDIWKRQFDLVDLENPEQSEKHQNAFKEKVEILCNTIAFCRKNHYRPIMVIPPVPLVTRKHFSQAFLHEFLYSHVNKIKESYDWIKVLDYMADERFCDEHFKNDIFLNDNGAKTFSTILFNDIEKIMGGKQI